VSTRNAVLVVPKTVEALLDTKPNDVRDRNLVRFSSDIVDRINIESPGREKIVLARKGESWVRKAEGKDVAINVAAATRLMSELQSAQVVNFVADVGTELPKYGLDQPQVTVTLSSYSSENTAETKAGEKPIVAVLFGKAEGENVYAKLDDEPFIVSVSQSLLSFAMTDPLQWQELAIYKNKPEDITGLEIAREGQPTITLERDKDKNWKFNVGDLKERERWGDYMDAYQDALEKCSTKHAPWYVVPADKKWFRNWVISDTIVRTLKSLDMKYPPPEEGLDKVVVE